MADEAKEGRASRDDASTTKRSRLADSGASEAPPGRVDALERTALADPPTSSRSGPTASAIDTLRFRPFGPYSRVEPLADQGAMGLVAKGYNDAFGRFELVKFLRPSLAGEIDRVRQFRREGRVLARLSHPNVVTVYATYELDGNPCLAMEFLEGRSLGAYAEGLGAGFTVARATELMLDAARGLAAAHEVGLLHRDVKPDNLFVTPETRGRRAGLVLIDFGLAALDAARPDSHAIDPSLAADTSGGTPLYMAPEVVEGREASPSSDLYALGIAFYRVLTGRFPIADLTMRGVTAYATSSDPAPSIALAREDLPAPIVAIIDRLIAKRAEDRFVSADELVAALVSAESSTRPRRVPGSGPYRGLEPFTEAERDVFFGRDREVIEVLERLRQNFGVVLVGPSGSGKSSLVHAGVLPAVVEGALGGGLVQRVARVEPRLRPVRSLAAALSAALPAEEEDLVTILRREPASLAAKVRGALGTTRGLVLAVDQLEELATVSEDPSQAAAFAAGVGSLVNAALPNVRVIATVRADVMDRLFGYEALRTLLGRGFHALRPLSGDALERALLEPARAGGFRLEDESIAREIVEEVEKARAGLVLMSFAMAAWWHERDEARRVLPTSAWRALGGIAGALVRHADGVLEGLGPAERASAEKILVRLVTAEGTRQVVPRASLTDLVASGPAGKRALARLAAQKLVVESENEVELVHEALVTEWPRLRRLLAERGRDHEVRERITAAAASWEGQGRADGVLWDGDQARELLRWFGDGDVDIGQAELPFIEAVRERHRRRRIVVRVGVMAGVLAIGGGALGLLSSQRRTERALDLEITRRTEAEGVTKAAAAALFTRVAELEVERSPNAALRALHESRDRVADPKLDAIAWRARHRGVARALPLHEGGTALVRVARTGSFIATAGERGTVHVLGRDDSFSAEWSLEGRPTAMRFSDDGQALAVGSERGALVVAKAPAFGAEKLGQCGAAISEVEWRARSHVVVRCGDRVIAHSLVPRGERVLSEGPLRAVDIAENGSVAVVVTPSHEIAIIAAETGVVEPLVKAGSETVTAVAVAAQGSELMLVLGDEQGRVANARRSGRAGALAPRWIDGAHAGAVRAVAVTGDGERAASLGADQQVVLWKDGAKIGAHAVGAPVLAWGVVTAIADAEHAIVLLGDSGAVVGRLAGATDGVTSVALDREWLVAASRDGGVRAWKIAEAAPLALRSADGAACGVSADGAEFACLREGSLERSPTSGAAIGAGGADLQGKTRVPLESTPPAARVDRIVVGAGGRSIAWQVASGTAGYAFGEGKGTVVSVEATDGKEELVGAPFTSRAEVVHARSGALTLRSSATPGEPLPWQGRVSALAASRGDDWLAIAREREVAVATLEEDRIVAQVSIPTEGPATALALSDGAERVAIGLASGRVSVTKDRTASASAPEHVFRARDEVTCLAWTRDGRGLSVGSADGALALVDVDTGASFAIASLPSPIVSCARRTHDDGVVVVLRDGSVWLRVVDTTPLGLSAPAEDPADPGARPFFAWQGLEPSGG